MINDSSGFPTEFPNMFELNMPTANVDQGVVSDKTKLLSAVPTESPTEAEAKVTASIQNEFVINEFPRHLFVPNGAESLDLRAVWNIPPATVNFSILRFVCPPGAVTRFIKYGVFNDGLAAVDYAFKPLVNGNRIARYHGEPLPDGAFRIALGLAPDLGEEAMIPYQITLNPGDILEWLVTNNSIVDTSMGVRMIGYFDTQAIRVTPKFG